MDEKRYPTTSTYKIRATHYISSLRVPFDIYERQTVDKMPLVVYEFDPKPNRQFWTYLTSGMSEKEQRTLTNKVFTELLFYSKDKSPIVPDLLAKLSTYPFEYGEAFLPGDTLPLSNPISSNSKLTSLLLLEPFLENSNFQVMDIHGRLVDILWVLPITQKECELISSYENINFREKISGEHLQSFLNLNRDSLIDI